MSISQHHQQSPITPTSSYPLTTTTTGQINSLSPTVNVAGSLTKYICPYCYKVFNWKTNMNRHISVTHLMKPKPTIKVGLKSICYCLLNFCIFMWFIPSIYCVQCIVYCVFKWASHHHKCITHKQDNDFIITVYLILYTEYSKVL